MPRTWRASVGGYCYHVINRGNDRAQFFHDEDQYAGFVRLMREANVHVAMRIVGFCLMPNHIHLVLWPEGDGDLSRWMQWLLTTHVRRRHRDYRSSGHIWQGRFHAFPIEQDEHLLTVVRYVERNPLRANLVARAENCPWSSLREVVSPSLLPFLHPGPVARGVGWLDHVNGAHTEKELKRLRQSVAHGVPFGNECWTQETAGRLGLESTMRPRGRPRKSKARSGAAHENDTLFPNV